MESQSKYSRHFVVRGKDVRIHASQYLTGLLGTQRRKNIECIGAESPQGNYQGMQQLLSDSPWCPWGLFEQIAQDARELLGGHRDSALYVEEFSFIKKGDQSVGVGRQYNRSLGRIENCQVGLFAGLGRGERTAVIDCRLFLPEAWVGDAARCRKAKVPEAQRKYRTKTQLALEMVKGARERGGNHQWIGTDAGLGSDPEFCTALDELGEKFVMDVLGSTQVWDRDLGGESSPPPDHHGDHDNDRPVSAIPPARQLTIQDLVGERFEKESREIIIRPTREGFLRARIWVCPVWSGADAKPTARERVLIVQDRGDRSLRYSWSNLPSDTSCERLAYMQCQREWVAGALETAKNELGMAQYEVRGWKGWHHHMALVSLAMLFVVREKVANALNSLRLSTHDIAEMMDFYLPKRAAAAAENPEPMAQVPRGQATPVSLNGNQTPESNENG